MNSLRIDTQQRVKSIRPALAAAMFLLIATAVPVSLTFVSCASAKADIGKEPPPPPLTPPVTPKHVAKYLEAHQGNLSAKLISRLQAQISPLNEKTLSAFFDKVEAIMVKNGFTGDISVVKAAGDLQVLVTEGNSVVLIDFGPPKP